MRLAISLIVVVLLSACNHPDMWLVPPAPVTIEVGIVPPFYPTPTRTVCYSKWGDEITAKQFRERGYRYYYGDHCWEVGIDTRKQNREGRFW